MSTPEGKVKDAVKKRLREHGVFPFTDVLTQAVKPSDIKGMYYMPVPGRLAIVGIHDFIGCWNGTMFTLETKGSSRSDATHHQEMFRIGITAAGGISLTGVRDATAVDKLAELINERVKNGRTIS